MKKFFIPFFFISLFSLFADDFTPDLQLALSTPEYIVTPGDVYSLIYYADGNEIFNSILIDSSCRIRISNFIDVDVNGKSYTLVKQEVENAIVKKIPKSSPVFTLSKPAIFKIVVNGEVEKTVEKQIWALCRLSSVVDENQNDYSSCRFASVTPYNGKKTDYDLVKASREGDLSQDPFLRPGDTVTIKRSRKKVCVSGAVERPGIYELDENENLISLLSYHGSGLVPAADLQNIELIRKNNGSSSRIIIDVSSLKNDYELNDEDEINVPNLYEKNPLVYIESGEQRIAVRVEKDMNLSDFVRSNYGIFTSSSDIQNAYIIRAGKIIPVDLTTVEADETSYSGFILKDKDTMKIPFKEYFVFVTGSVVKPGKYPYVPDKTYEFYINMAGGFIKSQNSKDAVDIIDVNGKKLSKSDIIAPETQIVAKTNSGLYYFNQYMGIIATLLSIVSTVLLTINFIKK